MRCEIERDMRCDICGETKSDNVIKENKKKLAH